MPAPSVPPAASSPAAPHGVPVDGVPVDGVPVDGVPVDGVSVRPRFDTAPPAAPAVSPWAPSADRLPTGQASDGERSDRAGEWSGSVPPSTPGGALPVAGPVAPGDSDDVVMTPLADGVPVERRRRRSKLLVGSAVLAVLAIGAAGIFAVANLTRPSVGGAEQPVDLGTELMRAIEAEDLLGVIDVLVPGERRALGEPFVALVTELQRLEVLADTDLSSIAGLDIELSNEVVRTKLTNVDDIVNIAMSADLEVSIDGARLPIGELVTDNMPDDMLAELEGTRITETDRFDISLTAVLEDGRWYFSLLHTIAEQSRREIGADLGIPFQGIGHDGADSPEAAVDRMLDRIEQLDLAGVIRSLDPDEAAALQRYAPLFLEDAQAVLDDVGLDLSIGDRSFRVDGSGDRRTVVFDGLSVSGSIDGDAASFTFDGDCITADLAGERIEQCGSVGGFSDLGEAFGDEPEIVHLVEVVQASFSDLDPIGLELRSHDGEWFVSPIASMTDAMLAMLRALDRQELDRIIDAVESAAEAFGDSVFGPLEQFGTDDFGITSNDVVDDAPLVDAGPLVDSSGDPSWYDCYEFDADDATACFESSVAAGEITAAEIPVVLRFPECGYAEASWSGTVYGLPDDEFMALTASARACFLDLVERGEIDDWELPDELLHLECFEDRNWYQVFDDPEYDIRVDECRSASVGVAVG